MDRMDPAYTIDRLLLYGAFTGVVMQVLSPRNDKPTKKLCYVCYKKYPTTRQSQIQWCSDECMAKYRIIRKEQLELDKRERETS
ncbi:MAG TPA: hypothetical protein VL443_06480 [Cyclobacteriaceae bacterium]|nr:hypothetical protein [Cyclobacteriaceae bacterium]